MSLQETLSSCPSRLQLLPPSSTSSEISPMNSATTQHTLDDLPLQNNGFSNKSLECNTDTHRHVIPPHTVTWPLQHSKQNWNVILTPNHCHLTMVRLFHMCQTSGKHSLCPLFMFHMIPHATYLYLFTMAFFSKPSHQTSPTSNWYPLISGYQPLWPFRRFLCLAPSLCQYIKWPYILTLKGDLLMNTNSDS